MQLGNAPKMFGQWAPRWLLLGGGGTSRAGRSRTRWCWLLAFGATHLQFFQFQLKLFDLALDLLRLASELHPLQLGDQQLQVFNLMVTGEKLLVLV